MHNKKILFFKEEVALDEFCISDTDTIKIVSLGFLGRYIKSKHNPKNTFYMKGSMGICLSFGIGIAMCMNKPINCIIGDGSLIMNLQSLLIFKSINTRLNNFRIFLFDNQCHNSTGQQSTNSEKINFSFLAKTFDIRYHMITNIKSLKKEMEKTKEYAGISLLHIKVSPMSIIPKRIAESSMQIKNTFLKKN